MRERSKIAEAKRTYLGEVRQENIKEKMHVKSIKEMTWKKSETNKQARKRETGKIPLSTVSFGILCYS